MKITILTPVYNDWKSASKLIEEINTIVKDLDAEFSLFIVNDASTEEKPTTISSTENLSSIEILNIKKNKAIDKSAIKNINYELETIKNQLPIPFNDEPLFEELYKINNKLWILAEFSESRFPVGSSKNINFGLFTIDLAMAALCFSPPDNFHGR